MLMREDLLSPVARWQQKGRRESGGKSFPEPWRYLNAG